MSTPAIRIRPCTPADAPALALTGAATFLEAFADFLPAEAILTHTTRNHSVDYYARALALPTSAAWLAESLPGTAPIGYALNTLPDFDPTLLLPGDTELRRIYVFSRFRHGTPQAPSPGQQLMTAAIAQARAGEHPRLLLGVHRNNTHALAFYARNGFKETGTRHFQLGTSTFDDLVLALELA